MSEQLKKGDEKFVARLIREVFIIPRNKKSECAVCGKYKSIAHAHHVYPVSKLAKLVCQAELTISQLEGLPVKYVWVCPNHHALFHVISDPRSSREGLAVIEDIGIEEYRTLKVLFDLLEENSKEIMDYIIKVRYGN